MEYGSLHNERDILQRLSQGDKMAFRQLYDHYWNNIYGTALSFLKSPERAQDLVQDVFLTIWEKRTKLVKAKDLSSYIYIMARNKVISAMRKKTEAPLQGNYQDVLPADLLSPEQSLDTSRLSGVIQKAISQLSRQQQIIFRLSREEGLSHREIAQQLGIEERTVSNHITTALNKLRRFLAEYIELILLFGSLDAYLS